MKGRFRTVVLPLVLVLLGGLLAMAATLALYALIFNGLETWMYPNDPQMFPADQVRRIFAVVMVLLYLPILLTRIPDSLKAILMTGPMAAVIITIGHALYLRPVVSVAAMLAAVGVAMVLLYRHKKPWIYYYAAAISALVALFYAWPRI